MSYKVIYIKKGKDFNWRKVQIAWATKRHYNGRGKNLDRSQSKFFPVKGQESVLYIIK